MCTHSYAILILGIFIWYHFHLRSDDEQKQEHEEHYCVNLFGWKSDFVIYLKRIREEKRRKFFLAKIKTKNANNSVYICCSHRWKGRQMHSAHTCHVIVNENASKEYKGKPTSQVKIKIKKDTGIAWCRWFWREQNKDRKNWKYVNLKRNKHSHHIHSTSCQTQ